METPPNNNSLSSLEEDLSNTTSQKSLDIEMITVDSSSSSSYTSLKDLILMSPSSTVDDGRKNSWREIPIKDPLVQHAAWAYLQPMALDSNEDRKLKDKVCGVLGCLNDAVLGMFKGWFVTGDQVTEHEKEDEEEEELFE